MTIDDIVAGLDTEGEGNICFIPLEIELNPRSFCSVYCKLELEDLLALLQSLIEVNLGKLKYKRVTNKIMFSSTKL